MGSEVSEVNAEMTGLHDQVKRKVSPALIYVTRNESKWGGLTVEFRAFVTSALDKVSGQLNVTAVLTPRKDTAAATEWEGSRTHVLVWTI